MAFDAHANLASSLISTAPSPDVSGTSLTISPGQGVLFPVPPFNCTVAPYNTFPTQSNAEIVRVTAIVGDTFTIVRAQEGTTAKNIAAGWLIANSITVKDLTDIEAVALGGTVTAVTGAAPVVSSGGTTPQISMAQANTSTDGYLSSTDWNTFNGKQPAGSYLTNGGPLGTPSSGTLTNATDLPIVGGTTGTLSVARGGTGDTTYTNGQLLIGNTTGNTLAKGTLTGTANQVVVTNGAGSITLSTPQDIGTSSSPTFNNPTATGAFTSTRTLGAVFNDTSAATTTIYFQLINNNGSGGTMFLGVSGSTSGVITGSTAYDTEMTGTSGISFSRDNGATVGMRLGSEGLAVAKTVKPGSYTVTGLPSAATAGGGALAYVTDANATTRLSTVAGGGSNKVMVFSDGTNWLIV